MGCLNVYGKGNATVYIGCKLIDKGKYNLKSNKTNTVVIEKTFWISII